MTRWIAAAALALMACASEVAPAGDAAPSVWLPEDHPLYEAQQAWGLPLPYAPEVVLDFGTREQVGLECGFPGTQPTACTQLATGRMLFASGETPERLAAAKLHEVGHLLAGTGHGEHIVDPIGCPVPTGGPDDRHGDYIMCTYGRLVPELTPADFEFVLGH